jgi:hypothetical protein
MYVFLLVLSVLPPRNNLIAVDDNDDDGNDDDDDNNNNKRRRFLDQHNGHQFLQKTPLLHCVHQSVIFTMTGRAQVCSRIAKSSALRYSTLATGSAQTPSAWTPGRPNYVRRRLMFKI